MYCTLVGTRKYIALTILTSSHYTLLTFRLPLQHGTCPICRKMLSEDNEARLGFPHTGGLEALLRYMFDYYVS